MNIAELQMWLGAHGQPVLINTSGWPETRAAIIAAFTNLHAPAVTDGEIEIIASRLACSTKQLRAIGRVESSGGGYDDQGRPKILFERHKFHLFTDGAFTPSIFSNPVGGGYATDSWEKLTLAACEDPLAAFAATSWGKFQVLGMHACGGYPKALDLGYPNPLEMAYSTVIGEAAHYEMMARYVEQAGLLPALRRISSHADDCRAFARGYNGSSYERFSYHEKLAMAMR